MPLNWSHTLSQEYRQCPRKVFYRKKSAGRKRNAEKRTLLPWEFVGDTVHKAIEKCLIQSMERHDTESIDEMRIKYSELRDIADGLMDEALDSRELAIGSDDREQVEPRLRKTVKTHLKQWHGKFKSIYKGHTIIEIEGRHDWPVEKSKVVLIIDLLTSDSEGRLWITDWKTSATKKRVVNEPQLTVYKLWAKETHDSFDSVVCTFFYTKRGERDKVTITDQYLDTVSARIISEIQDWDSDQQEQFPTKPSRHCNECKWRLDCPDRFQ